MNIPALIEEIESSAPYKKWRSETEQKSFLASLFASVEDEKPINWHVNYYTPGLETATTFTVLPDIARKEDSPMSGDEPAPLRVEESQASFPEVLENAAETMQKEYAKYTYTKVLATLHQEESATWNLNFLTTQAAAVLMRVSAENGQVLDHKELSLSDFTQRM